MNRHIGLLIKAEMERQERTPSWLAQRIFCDRTNIHKIYKKESIDTEQLFHISKALNHNFFSDLSEDYSDEECGVMMLSEEAENYHTGNNKE